jgi:hypothetical protein
VLNQAVSNLQKGSILSPDQGLQQIIIIPRIDIIQLINKYCSVHIKNSTQNEGLRTYLKRSLDISNISRDNNNSFLGISSNDNSTKATGITRIKRKRDYSKVVGNTTAS